MKNLVELHNQYIAGLITFSEFMLGVMGEVQNEEAVKELLSTAGMEFKELIQWEEKIGVNRNFYEFYENHSKKAA